MNIALPELADPGTSLAIRSLLVSFDTLQLNLPFVEDIAWQNMRYPRR